jgi:hypothetical protein
MLFDHFGLIRLCFASSTVFQRPISACAKIGHTPYSCSPPPQSCAMIIASRHPAATKTAPHTEITINIDRSYLLYTLASSRPGLADVRENWAHHPVFVANCALQYVVATGCALQVCRQMNLDCTSTFSPAFACAILALCVCNLSVMYPASLGFAAWCRWLQMFQADSIKIERKNCITFKHHM